MDVIDKFWLMYNIMIDSTDWSQPSWRIKIDSSIVSELIEPRGSLSERIDY